MKKVFLLVISICALSVSFGTKASSCPDNLDSEQLKKLSMESRLAPTIDYEGRNFKLNPFSRAVVREYYSRHFSPDFNFATLNIKQVATKGEHEDIRCSYVGVFIHSDWGNPKELSPGDIKAKQLTPDVLKFELVNNKDNL